MSNYPDNVTGDEYEIAGPDSEDEVECPECGKIATKESYRGRWRIDCDECNYHEEGSYYDDAVDYYFETSQDR